MTMPEPIFPMPPLIGPISLAYVSHRRASLTYFADRLVIAAWARMGAVTPSWAGPPYLSAAPGALPFVTRHRDQMGNGPRAETARRMAKLAALLVPSIERLAAAGGAR
jgi:hypothetical protein